MKIIGVFFEVNDKNIYTHLTKVFEYSIKKNMPGSDTHLEIYELPPPVIEGKRFQHQIIKQRKWTELALQQTENYVIMDTDMIITGSLEDAFQYPFDIAYTYRKKERKPLNGGMIFGRPNERSKRFWEEWLFYCEKAYANKDTWIDFNSQCKGFAQSALWHTINNNKECKFKRLDCSEYNACDEEWDYANAGTKAYHIKGRMRKALFNNGPISSPKVYNLWKDYERQYYGCN
jgi:hypothetical protein